MVQDGVAQRWRLPAVTGTHLDISATFWPPGCGPEGVQGPHGSARRCGLYLSSWRPGGRGAAALVYDWETCKLQVGLAGGALGVLRVQVVPVVRRGAACSACHAGSMHLAPVLYAVCCAVVVSSVVVSQCCNCLDPLPASWSQHAGGQPEPCSQAPPPPPPFPTRRSTSTQSSSWPGWLSPPLAPSPCPTGAAPARPTAWRTTWPVGCCTLSRASH
jgi:hypothetical protein